MPVVTRDDSAVTDATSVVSQHAAARCRHMPTSRPARRRRLFCRRAALLSLGCATGRAQFQPAAFVHIPKTGGTSIHRALFDADCPALPITDAFTNHQLTAAAATRDGGRCFAPPTVS